MLHDVQNGTPRRAEFTALLLIPMPISGLALALAARSAVVEQNDCRETTILRILFGYLFITSVVVIAMRFV